MSFETLNQALLFTDSNGNKWYRGKVITNVDPKNFDRIQCTVPGMYDPDLGPIPWCGPMKMSPFGFGSGYGVFGTPAVGSDVMVTLQGGDPHYPMYMHLQCFANPSDFPSGQAWGFIDPQGNKLVIAGKDIKFQSGGGYQMHIDASGNFTVTAPSGATGTFNVPHVVYNSTDFTINAANFTVTATTLINLNEVTIDPTGNILAPTLLTVTGLATFDAGFSANGPALSDGHNIGYLHHHTGGTFSGGVTGPVNP